MGVTLTYVPVTEVSTEVAATIRADAKLLQDSHEWWAEPICFVGKNSLEGATKIFLPGYSTEDGGYEEVEIDDDSLMAAYDAKFILDTLSNWSRTFGMSWIIGIDGEEIGQVGPEGPDSTLLAMVAAVATNGSSDEMPTFDEVTIKRIQAKYANRL